MSVDIVCTLGPASSSEAVLRDMLTAGMTLARFNFSHGQPDEHRQRAELVRQLARNLGCPLELIQDLQGPKIRTVHTPPTELQAGDQVVLSPAAGGGRLQIAPAAVLTTIQPGHRVFLDDGAIELETIARRDDGVVCRVVIGGPLDGNQGVVFPDSTLAVSALTEKDVADAAVGREIGFEWVALSFVQRWQDLEALRVHLRPGTRVIAKIETRAALDDLTAIVADVDAAMIARGDLAVSIPRARVPLAQKDIIRACRQQGTGSIVATEMLLSMAHNPHPTRAEVSDVATAVLDGCNAVMLSEETAIGGYPVQAVAQMHEIVTTVIASEYYVW